MNKKELKDQELKDVSGGQIVECNPEDKIIVAGGTPESGELLGITFYERHCRICGNVFIAKSTSENVCPDCASSQSD